MARVHKQWVLPAALGLLPWTWFAWRDGWSLPVVGHLPPRLLTEPLAIALPVVVALAVVAAVVVAVLGRRVPVVAVAASLVLFGLVAVVLPWRPAGGPGVVGGLRVVVANTKVANDDPAAVARLVAEGGDVVVVPEVSPRLHQGLLTNFAHGLRAFGGPHQGAVGVYSRFPLDRDDQRRTLTADGAFRLLVEAPTGPLVLYAAHLTPPGLGRDLSPAEQARLVGRLRDAVDAEAAPVVVAGDLNLVDRSALFRQLTDDLDDATSSAWRRPTSLRWWPFLARIDHILVGPGWCGDAATTFSVPGSDHRGIAATVGACAPS